MAGATLEEHFRGSLLGLALGDAIGAPFEGGVLEQLLWRGIARGRLRWTDDTQMALGTVESLLECDGLDPDHLARRWAANATWSRGYGPGARRLLARIARGEDWREANRRVFPDGSFGNGAAMRAAPLGLYYHRDAERLEAATATASSITHAHPLGIAGGVLIARATALALDPALGSLAYLDALRERCGETGFTARLVAARELLGTDPPVAEVRNRLGNGIRAEESAVTAVYAFCRHRDRDFAALMEWVVALRGDTDTIGAMAGGIWGASRGVGALPDELLDRLEQRAHIDDLARRLWRATEAPST
jgi:poly(ADP-ribose) glycohydrolase ARH3